MGNVESFIERNFKRGVLVEFEQLKSPFTPDSPCGENLEDTQLLASFDSFRLFGQVTPLVPTPDWRDIKSKSLAALEKSKDVRLLGHLGAAVLRTDGLPAFVAVLQGAAFWTESYWEQFYPRVEDDAILRRNAFNSFADRMAVVDGLRRLPLVANRQLGGISLRDIEIAAGQLAPSETDTQPRDQAQVDAVFAAAPLEELTTLKAGLSEALAALKTIESRMREAGGSEAAPTFDALLAAFTQMQKVLHTQLAARGDAMDTTADEASEGVAQSGGSAVAVGSIRTRQDAIRALDAVASFFRQNEPSSPIPLFIERAKRLVAKDFLAVLADIAPEALGQAKAAGGVKDE